MNPKYFILSLSILIIVCVNYSPAQFALNTEYDYSSSTFINKLFFSDFSTEKKKTNNYSKAQNKKLKNYFTSSLDEGLIAYYPFNGNANDESGNGYHGIVTSATLTTDIYNNANNAYYFDGVNDFISIPDFNLSSDSAVTVRVLARPDNLSSNKVLFYHGINGAMQLSIDSNKVYFSLCLTNATWYHIGSDISEIKWYDIVGVWKKGESMKLYIDGVFRNAIDLPNNTLYSTGFVYPSSIGVYARCENGQCRYHKGKADEIRVYNRALLESEIQQLNNWTPSITLNSPNGGENYVPGTTQNITWNSFGISNIKIELTTNNGISWSTIISSYAAASGSYPWTIPNTNSYTCKIRISDVLNSNTNDLSDNTFTIATSNLNIGLVAYYPFNNNYNDESGNGNNCWPEGNVTFVNGISGKSVRIIGDGNEGYSGGGRIRMPLINYNSMPSFSISLWVKDSLIGNGAECYFFQGNDGQGNSSIAIWHHWSNILFQVNLYGNVISVPFRQIDSNKFVLYTMTYSNGTLKAYRNSEYVGSLNESLNSSYGPYAGLASHFWWGQYSSARFKGLIDDVRIYNRALSQSEIQQLYDQVPNTTLTSQNNGGNYHPGDKPFITWTSNKINQVKIELSTNNGTSWPIHITTQHASNKSYEWTIPGNINSTQCKIKISDNSNPGVFDVSDGVFSITPQTQNNVLLNFKVIDPFGTARKLKFYVYDIDLINFSDGIFEHEDDIKYTFYKDIVNSNVEVTEENISTYLKNDDDQIRDIEIIDKYESYMGHIKFKYTKDSLEKGNRTDAIIIIDDQYRAFETGKIEFPEWKYCKTAYDKLVYMLIPPGNKFDLININKKPALFVHGIYGFYPYWGAEIISSVFNAGYDTWQFYYPYDQYNYYSGQLLRKTITEILKEGGPIGSYAGRYSDSVYVAAHSMGGLVARSYIQDEEYNKDIKKIIMLGTPNHGSYSSYRVRHETYTLTGIFAYIIGKDKHSPAHNDLMPANNWLYDLYSQSPKMLQDNVPYRNSYFVVAGTKDEVRIFHDEIESQDDGVVAISSASLLNYNIPIATIDKKHTKLPVDVPPQIILNFFASNYEPISGNSHVNIIKEFSTGLIIDANIPALKWENGVDITKGILYFKLPESMKNYVDELGIDKLLFNTTNYRFVPNRNKGSDKMRKLHNSSNYYSLNDAGRNQLGLNLGANANKKYSFWNYKGKNTPLTREYDFTFKPLQTSMVMVNLQQGEISGMLSKADVKPSRKKLITSKEGLNVITQNLFIDSSLDSLVFYLFANDTTSNFADNNFKMISPTGIIIDSAYCASHSDYEYQQSLSNKFVYYFVRNPQPGNWTAQYNSAITDAELFVPILSTITTSVNFRDTSYVAGDTLIFTVSLPTPINYTNVQMTATIDFSPRNTDSTISLGSVSVTQLNDTTYIGKYISTRSGIYTINLEFSCVKSGETIERHTSGSVSVISIAPPVLTYPPQDTTQIPVDLVLKWKPTKFATKYCLQVYASGDTVAFADINNLSDTIFYLDSLVNNMSYLWRLKAYNSTDTSSWSELRSFSTIVSAPGVTMLSSPPDNSGGIVTPVTLKWGKSDRAEKYHLITATDTSFTNIIINDSTVTDTLKVLSNLNILTYYYWKVRAINDGGNGDFSQRWVFRTMGLPTTVSLIQPSDTSKNQPVKQAFRWSKSFDQTEISSKKIREATDIKVKSNNKSDVEKGINNKTKVNNKTRGIEEPLEFDYVSRYWFELVKDTLTMAGLIRDTVVTDTVKFVTGLDVSTNYYWRIKSVNEIGWSGFSKWNKFSTINSPDVSESAIPTLGGGTTMFGITNMQLSANVTNPKYVNVEYYTIPPVEGEIPTGLNSISNYFWSISDSGIQFSDGYIRIPLSFLGGVTDPSKLRWVKRSYAGDDWIDIGGIIQDGYLVSTVPFSSFSEFAIGSQDAQPLTSTNIRIKVIPEGFYDAPNNRLNCRDSVIVYLREVNTPFTVIDSSVSIIDSLNFTAFLEFKNAPTGSYYIVIKHRNSLETWSKSGGILFTKYTSMNYDFTSANTQAYGNNLVQKGTKWCIYSGDVNQDGVVDLFDLIDLDNDNSNFITGYTPTDLNGDQMVDLFDLIIGDNNNANFVAAVKPPGALILKKVRKPEEYKKVDGYIIRNKEMKK